MGQQQGGRRARDAMLFLLTSIVLMIRRPAFMTLSMAVLVFLLNVVQLASTFRWQRKLQAQMAETGFDAQKTKLLLSTNWIRTIAFLTQAVLATGILLQALGPHTR